MSERQKDALISGPPAATHIALALDPNGRPDAGLTDRRLHSDKHGRAAVRPTGGGIVSTCPVFKLHASCFRAPKAFAIRAAGPFTFRIMWRFPALLALHDILFSIPTGFFASCPLHMSICELSKRTPVQKCIDEPKL